MLYYSRPNRRPYPSTWDPTYKVSYVDGLTLVRGLEALRKAAPFRSRGEAADALHEARWPGVWAESWILNLVLKDNRELRFDWVYEISKLPRDMDPQEAWDHITKGSFERSKAARLAFDLQWIAHARSREYRIPQLRDRNSDALVKRPIQTDGPKRRRFKPRDRKLGPHDRSWRCKCYYCRTNREGGARPTREARALRDFEE